MTTPETEQATPPATPAPARRRRSPRLLGNLGETLESKDRAMRGDDLKRGRGTIMEFVIAIGSHRAMAQGLRRQYQMMPCYLEECPQPAAAPAP